MRSRGAWLGLALAPALLLSSPAAADAATIFVDGSEPGEPGACGAEQNPCTTIQEGIDLADPGDVVQVAAGTYVEQLEIDEAITLRGDGDVTEVRSPADPVLEDKFGVGDERPVVFVHDLTGTGATIERLRVNGFANGGSSPPCDYTFYGVAFLNASGTLDDITVDHVRNQPFDDCDSGFAVFNMNDDPSARDWTVSDSTIEDYQLAGILASGDDLDVTITGNTVTGRFGQTELVQSGITLESGAGGAVSGNLVTDNACDAAGCGPDPLSDEQSGGIVLVGAADETIVSGNEVHSNDAGVLHGSEAGVITGVRTVTGNDLSDNRYQGISTYDGTLIATENEISGAEAGIAATSVDVENVPTVSATGNTITGNVTGIALLQDLPTTDAPTVSAAFNRIGGNAGAGLDNETDGTVNAENNWWGCNAGPADPACDAITEDEPLSVDADPHLVMKLIKKSKRNGRRQISANLRFNSDGTKFLPTDFPDGTEIAFTATRGTIPSIGTTIDGRAVVIHRKSGSTHKATITATLDGQVLAVKAR